MTENLKYAILWDGLHLFHLATGTPILCIPSRYCYTAGLQYGIHPIGSDAVYIAGEACTVNMTLDRSQEEIATDMEMCLVLHKGYSHE